MHMAYSDREAAQLASMGIKDVTVFKHEVARRLALQERPDAAALSRIEAEIVAATQGAFSLNSAIQSDRGFSLLPYHDCLHLAAIYMAVWEDFIDSHGVDHVLHEPVSLMFNFMASVVLTRRGGSYLYCIMATAEPGAYDFLVMSGFELFCPDLTRALEDPARTVRPAARSRDNLKDFLRRFRANTANFQGGVVAQSISLPLLAAKALKKCVSQPPKRRATDRLVDCIERWELDQNPPAEKLRNLLAYRSSVRFDEPDPTETYWFYPFHLEPEAVVLFQAHGLYTNQVKLIENIAAQLPPGHWLYVKDHPHNIGYRAAADYQRLNAVPNIRLVRPEISGKQLIRDARGVITITGTAGFEALLMGKPVVVFGRTFYSGHSGVVHLHHIRDLRAALAAVEASGPLPDEPILDFLAAYLASIHPGMTDFFAGQATKAGLDLDANARDVAEGLARTLREM